MTSWHKRDQDVVWHPYSHSSTADAIYPVITGAKDTLLYTEDGQILIDAISSWWVNLHGHCNAEITAAINTQLQNLDHSIFAGFTHKPAIELAERLLQIVPGQHTKVFYSDNGSTAVEVALKMALQYWHLREARPRRQKIVHLVNSYHGDTFGAMAVGHRSVFTHPFQSLLFRTESIPMPTEDNIDSLKDHLRDLFAERETAAFIFEPGVQGAGGFHMFELPLLDEILKICREFEVLTIADEVLTGFGRTGELFASNNLKNHPDIVCLAKGITGGFLPLAATTCNKLIASAFSSDDSASKFFHGHSYTANPIACAAANASIKLLLSDECQSQRERLTASMRQAVQRFSADRTRHHVRSFGTIFAATILHEQGSDYLNPISKDLSQFFYDRGILIRPLGNVLYIMPPYCILKDQLQKVFDTLEEYLDVRS